MVHSVNNTNEREKTMNLSNVANVTGWEDFVWTATVDGKDLEFFYNENCCVNPNNNNSPITPFRCQQCGRVCKLADDGNGHDRRVLVADDDTMVCSDCFEAARRDAEVSPSTL